ncbi:RmlC-like cupin, partial [Mollisia scopiformis]
LVSSRKTANSSVIVYDTPQYVRPYILPKSYGLRQGSAVEGNIYAVTGNSSGAFCLMITNGAGSGGAGVFPHVHKRTHENFYSSKVRVQLWSQSLNQFLSSANGMGQQSRILDQGDIGSVPPNTIHTFSLLDPDTTLTGVLVPGGFENLFFALDSNPALLASPTGLASFDVYPQPNFTARTDLVNGIGGSGNWHNGPNTIPNSSIPYFIAKDWNGKWLNDDAGYCQLVAPLVTPAASNNWFTQGTVTLSPKPANVTALELNFKEPVAFQMEEGMLAVEMGGERHRIIDGDVLFVPGNTTFKYWAEAEFTKFMYVCNGTEGLDRLLMAKGKAWESAFYPS